MRKKYIPGNHIETETIPMVTQIPLTSQLVTSPPQALWQEIGKIAEFVPYFLYAVKLILGILSKWDLFCCPAHFQSLRDHINGHSFPGHWLNFEYFHHEADHTTVYCNILANMHTMNITKFCYT